MLICNYFLSTDILSLNGYDVASISSITSPRYANNKASDSTLQSAALVEYLQKTRGSSNYNSARNSISGNAKSSIHPRHCYLRVKTHGPSLKENS